MSRPSAIGLILIALVTAYALIPFTGPQMDPFLRLLLLACVLMFLAGIAGLFGMFKRSDA